MLLQRNETTIAVLWDSPLEVSEHVGQIADQHSRKVARSDMRARTDKSHSDWYGMGYDEAMRAVREGWAEGATRLLDLEVSVPAVESIRRRRVRAEQGDAVDMQAVYRGDLGRAWERTRRMSRPTARVVTIVCDVTAAHHVEAASLYWRGAAALRACEALEGAGYSVQLLAAFGSRNSFDNGRERLAQFCEVKASDAPLDMTRLAGLLALPAWFRTALFAGIRVAGHLAGREVDPGYGQPAPEASLEGATLLGFSPSAVLLPQSVLTRDDAQRWLRETLPAILAPAAAAA